MQMFWAIRGRNNVPFTPFRLSPSTNPDSMKFGLKITALRASFLSFAKFTSGANYFTAFKV
jgi:hypothetical protein